MAIISVIVCLCLHVVEKKKYSQPVTSPISPLCVISTNANKTLMEGGGGKEFHVIPSIMMINLL